MAFALFLLLLTAQIAPATISIPDLPKEKKRNKKALVIPAPQAVPAAVEVTNGGTVQIPLRVFGKQEQTTLYLIRKQPELGKIVSVTPVDAEISVLTYQHTSTMSGEAKIQDKILFAAQNKNGTSAAAEIAITIVDIPPEFSGPGPIDFGEIAVGLPATRAVTVSNKGGGSLEGTVSVDAPWKIEPSTFKLRQGEKALFQLTIVPEAEREYQGHLHFVIGENQVQPAVHAKTFAPFIVAPADQTLKNGPGPARSGTLTLTNRTAAALKLQLEANPRLNLPSEVTLLPGKTEQLPVSLSEKNPEGIDTIVRITCGGIAKQVKIAAPRVTVPPPPPVATATPAPWVPPVAAPAPASTPHAQLPLPSHDTTPSPASTPAPPSTTAAPGHDTPPDSTFEIEGYDASIMDATGKPKIPLLQSIKVARLTPQGTVELTWAKPETSLGISGYRIEVRHIGIGPKDQMIQNWVPIPDAQFTSAANGVTALMTGVPIGRSFTIHILGLGAEGKPGAASLPVSFYIPPPQPFFTARKTLLLVFTVILACALGFKWLQKRKSPGR